MIRTLIILLVAAVASLAADNVAKEEVSLSPTHRLRFDHAEKLRYDVVPQPGYTFSPAMRFRCFESDGVNTLQFSLFASKDGVGAFKTQEDVDATVKRMGTGYVDMSVEKTTNTLRRIQPKSGFGAYCVFTDADLVGVTHLRSGEFRCVTVGLVKVGDYIFTVRGYSNTKDGADFKAVVDLLESLSIEEKVAEEKPKKDADPTATPRVAKLPTGQGTPEGVACDALMAYIRSDSKAWLAILVRPIYGEKGNKEYDAFKKQMVAKSDKDKRDNAFKPLRILKCFKARPFTMNGPGSAAYAMASLIGNLFVDVIIEVAPGEAQLARYHVLRDEDKKWYFEPRPDLCRLFAMGLNEESDSTEVLYESK